VTRVSPPAEVCYHRRVKNPGHAAILSFVIPGAGQIYNGDFFRALFWLIITPGFWVVTAGFFGFPFHFISAYTAYRRAERINRGEV
jgi:TM2 domain-containing membrane protein YozV